MNLGDRELITVIQIFRHGLRNPLKSYKVFKNELEYKPEELGQMTEKGREELYDLGIYTRNRYDNLLSSNYKDIKIYSTKSDRTIQSAKKYLEGFYHDIEYPEIEIHLASPYLLFILPREHPLDGFRKRFIKIDEECFCEKVDKNVVETLSKNLEQEFKNMVDIAMFVDYYIIKYGFDAERPEWMRNIDAATLFNYHQITADNVICTQEMNKFYMGPFWHYLTTHMENTMRNSSSEPKLVIFATHDIHLYAILKTLLKTKFEWPQCASSLYFELLKKNENYFVDIFYKNGTELIHLDTRINKAENDFLYENFKNILSDFLLSCDEMEQMVIHQVNFSKMLYKVCETYLIMRCTYSNVQCDCYIKH